MSNIQFNSQGVPLLGFGTKHFMSTTGAPKPKGVSKQKIIPEDKTSLAGLEIANWGPDNNFPGKANETIRSIGVLNTGLKYIRDFTLGQGIFPCHVIGYDQYGNEELKVINNKELINFCQSRMVRRYLEKLLRDYLKFGIGNVQLIPNEDHSKMVGINTINALYGRYAIAKDGVIDKIVVSGKWPDMPSDKEYEQLVVLDEYDPLADLERRKLGSDKKQSSYVFSVRDSWSNSDYYSEPIWYSAHLAGWTDIAKTVPLFLKRAYHNQITWKWHIKIPYAFWDRKFPKEAYREIAERQAAIEEYMDLIEENLCGTDNADKPIFTFFEINPNHGKAEEQWVIEPLDNKYKEGDKLFTSAAANSEILFSLMINPNVLGAGMPGGTYAGNQGGSNIREAFLVNIANSWIDRQNILDPLEAFLEFNGTKDVQLRFRSTLLTTLDTGAGTHKTLS